MDDGVPMRLCVACRTPKPFDREHFAPIANGLARTCRKCRTRIASHSRAKLRERDPTFRDRQAAAARRRRAGNPEIKRKEAQARKRWREKVKADPQRRARLLETERMSRRLRREREGKGTGRIAPRVVMAQRGPSLVPAAPLMALVKVTLERREAVAGLIAEDLPTVKLVCAELGVSPHNYRHWRNAPDAMAQVGTAERILLNAGVNWSDVYSYDDYAAHFLADALADI